MGNKLLRKIRSLSKLFFFKPLIKVGFGVKNKSSVSIRGMILAYSFYYYWFLK